MSNLFRVGHASEDSDTVSRETGFFNIDSDGVEMPSMTKQSFAEECDINTIVRRFGVTGELPPLPPPSNVEFDQVYDFQSAMNAIRAGEESFASLPAETRTLFNNSPAQFLHFVNDDDNRAQAELWGLVPPRAAPTPSPIPEGNVAPPGA